ncbi:3-hydroxyacyl-CoA dehydrogenase [Colletotrichum higginsianum IMI 349063]|uniref:3-hydroxyacyl-CoA dehydrogenase n=4 Tax=Colletotrichum higginsianum TaxID=80884 RepID=A0A1B7YEF2_COLHI|nr:3-hydroxyacyl-CoA dehydrogenase [Colletotrichum higginsianum IMI 349063]OBR10412.1 3-hydroxyacyl-CoA dehydrogenase [Colletotrichum higginsianum IMI 349063]TID06679.1 3-hydroxybutyryl-CoA dehydrogenase [Colletotrichum higginsianum]
MAPPSDYRIRPVAILGGGVLGRRIACTWASGGYNVQVREPDAKQHQPCLDYVAENVDRYPASGIRQPGTVRVFQDLETAVRDAWLVIEAVPERIEIKTDTFAELEAKAPADAVLASNSSSYRSSEMLGKIAREETKARIMNTHYYMPPNNMVVELMTDGHTDPSYFPFMTARQREVGTRPFTARKESTGFVFNRLWAAIKRETVSILAEGVSSPEEIDALFCELSKRGLGPCRMMDEVGLDTVAFIEDHYVKERGLSPENTVDFLQREYLAKGRLGHKSAKGGFYPHLPKIVALDLGLANPEDQTTSGQVLQLSAEGHLERVLAEGQHVPDGIDIDHKTGRMFWTCMGTPGERDGAVFSANADGSDVRSLFAPGAVNTPKQLVVDSASGKIYFSDREGMRVYRADLDGGRLETLVVGGDDASDLRSWCVGVSVAPGLGKFYWTQKGAPKSGQGRIFCAGIEMPEGKTAETRDDVVCVLGDLPEPIDLEVDEAAGALFWTDRGEIPKGNTLNRAAIDAETGLLAAAAAAPGGAKYEILVRHLNEAIGVKLDRENGHVYFSDLGGSIYRCNADGSEKRKIFVDENRAISGIAILRD